MDILLQYYEQVPAIENIYLVTVLQCTCQPTIDTAYSFDILWHLNRRQPVVYYNTKLYYLPKVFLVREVLEILNVSDFSFEVEWSYHLQSTDIKEIMNTSIENLTLTHLRLYL